MVHTCSARGESTQSIFELRRALDIHLSPTGSLVADPIEEQELLEGCGQPFRCRASVTWRTIYQSNGPESDHAANERRERLLTGVNGATSMGKAGWEWCT
jgi:hypothetical protein